MRKYDKRKILLIALIVIGLLCSILVYGKVSRQYKEISYNTFLNGLDKGIVKEVKLSNNSKIKILLTNGDKAITDNPRTQGFKEELLLKGVRVVEGSENLNGLLILIFVLFAVGILGYYINKQSAKSAEKEISDLAKIETGENTKTITFKDVAGNEEAKESLKEMVDFIKNPEIYNDFGARLPRGVLLYGPPGTGKTLLAKALAGEAGIPFYAVSGSDFVQVYAGLGASRIRELFKKAKVAGKSVIFIDEIDSLGKKRKGAGQPSGSEEGDRTLNALLTEMSGFQDNDGIIVVAATNRIDILDEALLRPGRFDRQLEVGLPDVNARHEILKLHVKNKPIRKDVDLKKVAVDTVYFSGAKLENLMNESAMVAVRNKSDEITMEHIDKAYLTVLVGEEKKDRSYISLKDKKITAYHEAGHALIAKIVSKDNRVTKVSIIPSTKGMGGFSLNIPPDKMYQTKKDILSNIMIALGGRAAEEIVFGKDNITTGASSDLEMATDIALSMIGLYGMDDVVGLINYNVLLNKDLGQDEDLLIRTKETLEKLYKETKELLYINRVKLDNLAKLLMERESIGEDEVNMVVNNCLE